MVNSKEWPSVQYHDSVEDLRMKIGNSAKNFEDLRSKIADVRSSPEMAPEMVSLVVSSASVIKQCEQIEINPNQLILRYKEITEKQTEVLFTMDENQAHDSEDELPGNVNKYLEHFRNSDMEQ